jgi:hypothetical protein
VRFRPCGAYPSAALSVSTAWQAGAEDLFRASHRVEVLLSATMGASADAGTAGRTPADLLSAIAELRPCGAYPSAALSASTAFRPPNANEFDRAYSTCARRE